MISRAWRAPTGCADRRRSAPWARLAAALALTVAACQERSGSGASDAPSPAPAAAARYEEELAAVDADLARQREAAQRGPAFWPAHELLARGLLERAWLTGSFDDYAGAVRAAETVERLGGPDALCPTGIRVDLAVHRLVAAHESLRRCERRSVVTPEDRIELTALRAELAFQQGRYDEALRWSRDVPGQRESPRDLARLARYHGATGAPVEAMALLDRAEKLDHAGTPRLRAWLALQRGLLALHRGRWEDALAHYLAAGRHLPGWWLVDEHVAEVRALLGQKEAAAGIYQRLLHQVDAPELMDAFAVLLRDLERPDEAKDWIARAETAHRRRMEQLSEAATGHAVDHFVRFAATAPETLALAQRNAQLRRNGDARLALVRALLAAGRTGEAEREIRAVRASAWDTAELHAVAHHVFQRAGKPRDALSEATRAQAMNPRWQQQYLVTAP